MSIYSPASERMARLSANETLTATILHELTQPLSAAAMHVSGLRKMSEPEGQAIDRESLDYGLERIEKAIRRCSLVISRMRSLVLDDRPVRAAVSIDHILQAAARAVEDVPGRDDVAIAIDAASAAQPVWCDGAQIEQVAINLLLNAIAACRSHPAPRITVRALARRSLVRGGFIEVSVADNGLGITPGQEDMLFRPFNSISRGGVGLGLAICRSLVELHGGDIWYERSPSGGSAFHFTLPQATRKQRAA